MSAQKKTFLIVGPNLKNLREYISAAGFEYLVLRDTSDQKPTTSKQTIYADVTNFESIMHVVQRQDCQYVGVLVYFENYVVLAARVAAALGLPHMPVESAKACTNKSLMRELFAKSSAQISPAFQKIESLDEALDFASNHEFPLIIKPTNLVKSLLISKVHDQATLRAVYEKTMQTAPRIYEQYAPNAQPEFIIEEFMEGPVYSVDAFVDSNGVPYVLESVVDYQTGFDIGFDDNFHYSRVIPSTLSQIEVAELREVAAAGCNALGMKNSPAHIEMIRTKNGPHIVEIGARNGGYRERMYRLANDIDMLGNLLRTVQGQMPSVEAKKHESCAALELFPKTAGIFTGISNEAALKQLPSFVSLAVKQPLGKRVGKSSDGFKMCAIIVLHHKNTKQLHKDLNFITQNVTALTAETY